MPKCSHKAFAMLLVAVVTAIPLVYMFVVTGSITPDVIPSLQPDSEYYLVQIQEVVDGKVWLGNPYIQEYSELRSPSVVLAVWIASIPALLGLSMPQVFIFNFIFYSFFTGFLLYAFLSRLTEGKSWLAGVMTGVGIAYIHNWLIRPIIMQLIFPTLLLFLLALHSYLQNKTTIKILLLGGVAVFAFYLYLYLWMVIFSALGFLTLWTMWNKDWKELKKLLLMWIGIVILVSPEFLYLVERSSDPLFSETAARLGFVKTHFITFVTFMNTKYLLLIAIGVLSLRFFQKKNLSTSALTLLFAIFGILLTTYSTLVTGVDINFVTHPWRIGLLLTVSSAAWFLAQKETGISRIIVFGCAGLLLLTILLHTVVRTKSFTYLFEADAHTKVQEYAVPLNQLRDLPSGVVLTTERLSCLLPIYTSHTVVYCGSAYYHPIPTEELFRRSILVQYPNIDDDFLESATFSVNGVGADLRAKDKNTRNYLCNLTKLCEDDGNTYTWYDEIDGDAFLERGNEYKTELDRNLEEVLQEFGVTYIVIDANESNDASYNGEILYEDERWKILRH